jgi:hypothetical protein
MGMISRSQAAIYVAAAASSWILAIATSSWILVPTTSRSSLHHFATTGLGILAATDAVTTSTWRPSDALGNAYVGDTTMTSFLVNIV